MGGLDRDMRPGPQAPGGGSPPYTGQDPPSPSQGETERSRLNQIQDPRKGPVTLYPHGGEREWSTYMHDEWKRDLGVEMVEASWKSRAEQAEEALREGEQVVMDALAMLRRPHAEELKRSEPYKRFKAALAGLPEREVNQQPQLPPRDRKMFGAGLPEGEKR